MLRYLSTICLLLLLPFAAFSQQPKNIDEAISYFEHKWTEAEKKQFSEQDENTAVAKLHLSVGMWIRNNWVRGQRDTALTKQFATFGIFQPDDISDIILTSLHRKLNKRPLDIAGQAEKHIAYWKKIDERETRQQNTAMQNYQRFKTGDSIRIYMLVDTSYGAHNAVLVSSPEEWLFNPDKDLTVEAIVLDKYNINSAGNVFLKVRISRMKPENATILMKAVKPGDTYDFSLRYLKIE